MNIVQIICVNNTVHVIETSKFVPVSAFPGKVRSRVEATQCKSCAKQTTLLFSF